MALNGSYSGLLASLADWLNRNDLTATIPDFVALAEADISRRLVIGGAPREMVGRAAAEIDDEFSLTPTDFMGARALRIEGSTKPLEYVDPETIASYKALYPSASGNPTHYSVVGVEFQYWPAPSDAVIIDLIYIKRIQSLGLANISNWLLTLYPDCYLYGALIQSAPYLKDDDRVAMWQQKYDQIIQAICMAGKRSQTAPRLALQINQNIV